MLPGDRTIVSARGRNAGCRAEPDSVRWRMMEDRQLEGDTLMTVGFASCEHVNSRRVAAEGRRHLISAGARCASSRQGLDVNAAIGVDARRARRTGILVRHSGGRP